MAWNKINPDDQKGKVEQRVARRQAERQRFQAEERRYTMIWHTVRKEFGISLIEYATVDTIHGLSNNRVVPGWCYASRQGLASMLGVTRQGLNKIIDRLTDLEKDLLLVEDDPETGYLRTTEKWIYAVELQKRRVNSAKTG